jgi:hypothetical protein
LIQWAQDNINEMEDLFESSLNLDSDLISEYEIPKEELTNLPKIA